VSRGGPVLAIGGRLDPIFRGTVERLAARGIDHCAIDLADDWLEHVSFDLALDDRVPLAGGNRICVGDRTILLDEVRGLLMRFLAWAPGNALTEPNGMFISSELNALFRFLPYRVACPAINRLRPDLWGFHLIDGTLLRRMVTVPVAVSVATLYASTVDASAAASAHHVPFCQSEAGVALDALSGDALSRIAKTLPLRLMPRCGGDELEVYVVGEAVHATAPLDAELAAASRAIARELGVRFCQLVWSTGGDGGPAMQRVHLFPGYDYRSAPPLDAICDSLVEELTS
jgi:hypothetical protein